MATGVEESVRVGRSVCIILLGQLDRGMYSHGCKVLCEFGLTKYMYIERYVCILMMMWFFIESVQD